MAHGAIRRQSRICDLNRNTGKLYVGSASVTMKVCGRDGTYANLNDPTGGNKEMIELRNKYGAGTSPAISRIRFWKYSTKDVP